MQTTVLGFLVPPEVAADYEHLAKSEGTTKSELFRRMVETYKAKRDEEELFRLQRRMARRARRRPRKSLGGNGRLLAAVIVVAANRGVVARFGAVAATAVSRGLSLAGAR